MPIQWDDSFSTGVLEIDRQHQEMILQLNSLGDAVQRSCGQEQIMSMLQTLAERASVHFRYEEQCMERLGCAAATLNRLAHQQLAATLQRKLAEIKAAGFQASQVIELHCILCEWLQSHIPNVDCQLRACVKRQS